ncbi:MAG: hypothetical protein O7C75_07655 [Verrucomicrobia bacterium]|nr:hypothetical protein [Verrucomicrobiota bacterium]
MADFKNFPQTIHKFFPILGFEIREFHKDLIHQGDRQKNPVLAATFPDERGFMVHGINSLSIISLAATKAEHSHMGYVRTCRDTNRRRYQPHA